MSEPQILEGPKTFVSLGVPASIASALEQRGITTPTPIQAATLPDSITGRDVLGRGRTGSGKTYAFLLPIVTSIMTDRYRPAPGCPRTLVLAPTRELVAQIEESLAPLKPVGKFTSHTIFGGVGQGPQVKAINRGLDIAIATPGRLEDLMRQGEVDLSQIETVVIDEADQMSDMGFLPMVTKILDRIPRDAQHLLFSATLDNQVQTLVDKFLTDPITHEADSPEDTAEAHAQMQHHALRVTHEDKPAVIADLCAAPSRAIVFARTKYGARNLSRKLTKMGVPALELHGNLTQNARMRNLNAFHEGKVTTLVATDIAARGIHVDDVEIVIHADPPAEHKAYVHRSGRTARAGNSGVVVTMVRNDQEKDVKSLMKKAGVQAEWANVDPDSELLFDLAPGGRNFLDRAEAERMIRDALPGQGQGSGAKAKKPAYKKAGQPNGNKARRHKPNGEGGKACHSNGKGGHGRNDHREGQGKGRGPKHQDGNRHRSDRHRDDRHRDEQRNGGHRDGQHRGDRSRTESKKFHKNPHQSKAKGGGAKPRAHKTRLVKI